MAQLLETDAVDRLALLHELLVAFDVTRRDAADFLLHAGRVGAAAHHGAVVEAEVVEGVEGLQRHVVGELRTGKRPQLFEDEGSGDDGGPGIEGEAVLPEHAGAAARLVQFLEDTDAIAPRTQPDRSRKPAKAAADDGGVGPPVSHMARRRGMVDVCKHQLTVETVRRDFARGR